MMGATVPAPAIADWLHDRCLPGDLILTGGRNPASRLLQAVSNSSYSHAAVVHEPGFVVEAYDYSLTMSELDEGVYETSFEDFALRSTDLSRLTLYRPPAHDSDRLAWTAEALHTSTPTYPTTAAVLFLGFEAAQRVWPESRRRPSKRRREKLRQQALYFGDGPSRVHCAELATRLYAAADVHLDFRHPLLKRYIDVIQPGDYVADDLPSPLVDGARSAQRGIWYPPGTKRKTRRLLIATCAGVSDLASAGMNRMLYKYRPDLADYSTPDDFTRARPLKKVADLRVRRGRLDTTEHL